VGEWSIGDNRRAAALVESMLRPMLIEVLETPIEHLDVRFRQAALRHRGVTVASASARPRKSAPSEVTSTFERTWGKSGVELATTTFSGTTAFAFGTDARRRIKSLIDRARTRPVEPAPAPAIADALTQTESILALIDFVSLNDRRIVETPAPRRPTRPVALGLGFADATLRIRLTVPAAQAWTMTTPFGW
jgi:hypothetical protein